MPANRTGRRSQTISEPPSRRTETTSPKSRILALLMACFFGVFGVHRFYVGKFWTGLLLFLTGGGFGFWWMIDVVLIALGRFEDAEGRVLGPAREKSRRLEPAEAGREPARGTDGHLADDEANSGEILQVETQDGEEVELDADEVMKDPVEEEFEELERQYESNRQD